MGTRLNNTLIVFFSGLLLGACGFPGPPSGGSGAPGGGGQAGASGGQGGTNSSGGQGGAGGTGGQGNNCDGAWTGDTCLVPPTEGAFLWLRSDRDLTSDGVELTWKDQISQQTAIANDQDLSDSVPSVMGPSPVFHGLPVVRFDGSPNRRIRLPAVEATFEQGFTAAFVVRAVAAHAGDGLLFLGVGQTASPYTDVIAISREDTSSRMRYTAQTNYDSGAWWDGIVQCFGGQTILPETPEIFIVTQRPEDGTVWMRTNGVPISKDWGDAMLPADTVRARSFLGWVPEGAFQGDLAEVLLYKRALDATERDNLEGYLAAKYDVPLAQGCASPCLEELASLQGIPAGIASSGDRVVWTNREGGQVMTISDAGSASFSAPQAIHAPGVTSAEPWRPALDATHVYWGDETSLYRAPLGGGSPDVLTTNARAANVAVDDDNMYAALTEALKIARVSKANWSTASYVETYAKVNYVAVDDTHLYWSHWNYGGADSGVYRIPKGQLDLINKELVMSGTDPQQIVFDADHVYVLFDPFEVTGTTRIGRIPKNAPGTGVILTEYPGGVFGLAEHGDHVYFSDSWTGKLWRTPKFGAGVEEVLSGVAGPTSLTIAGSYLVWPNNIGQIVRAPLP